MLDNLAYLLYFLFTVYCFFFYQLVMNKVAQYPGREYFRVTLHTGKVDSLVVRGDAPSRS